MVDTLTGIAQLNVPLINCGAPPQLDFSFGLTYAGNIEDDATTWNRESPTGICGLGWDLPLSRIARQSINDGNHYGDVFSLQLGSQQIRLVLTQEVAAGGILTQNYATDPQMFWSIRREQKLDEGGGVVFDRWIVMTQDGITYEFGGDVQLGADGNRHCINDSIGWSVAWNGWIGASTRVWIDPDTKRQRAQQQVAHSWMLSRIRSMLGETLDYAYMQDAVPIGGKDGLLQTRHVYLEKVSSLPGNVVKLSYGEKTPDECPPGRPLPDASPATAYQQTFAARYLSTIEQFSVLDADETPRKAGSVQLNYSFVGAGTSIKRVLSGVTRLTKDGLLAEPPQVFEYCTANNSEPVEPFGLLKRWINPGGSVTEYNYALRPIEGSSRESEWVNLYAWARDGAGKRPEVQVINGPDFALIVARVHVSGPEHQDLLTFKMMSFDFGRWEEKWNFQCRVAHLAEDMNWSSNWRVRVFPVGVMMLVDAASISHGDKPPPLFLSRDPSDRRIWNESVIKTPENVKISSNYVDQHDDWRCGAGNGIAAILDPTQGSLRLYSWNGVGWRDDGAISQGKKGDYFALDVQGGVVLAAGAPPQSQGFCRGYRRGPKGWERTFEVAFDPGEGMQLGATLSLSISRNTACLGAYLVFPISPTHGTFRYEFCGWGVVWDGDMRNPRLHRLHDPDHPEASAWKIDRFFGEDTPGLFPVISGDVISVHSQSGFSQYGKGVCNWRWDGAAWLWSYLESPAEFASDPFALSGARTFPCA